MTYNTSEWICNFMKTTENCQIDDGFINYLVFSFCSFDYDQTWIPALIMAILLFFLFISLGVTADTLYKKYKYKTTIRYIIFYLKIVSVLSYA